MKQLLFILSIIFCLSIITCKKINIPPSTTEYLSNQNLLNKPLSTIRATVAGKWQVQRTHFFASGVAGYTIKDSIYKNNTGDFVSFLKKDTVIQTDFTQGIIKIYERAIITKKASGYGTYNGFLWNVDSVFVYNFTNAYLSGFTMIEIKNDTLVTYGPALFTTTYFLKKP